MEIFGKKFEKRTFLFFVGVPLLLAIVLLMLYLGVQTTAITVVSIFGMLIIGGPYFLIDYLEFQKLRKAEDAYPTFLRDLTQAVNSGMTIPQAINTISETNYGELSKYIKKLQAWISWDVPFPKAWNSFTDLLYKSSLIRRVNAVIIEGFLAGGDLGAILSSLSQNVDTIKRMEEDKRATMMEHLGVMYVVFLVFLGTIIVLYKILLPILYLQRFSVFAGISFRPSEVLGVDYFRNLFLLMTIVQAGSLGMIAGQITEEKLIGGFKHVIVMLAIGLVVFMIAIFPAKLSFDVEVSPQELGPGQEFIVSGQVFWNAQPASGAKLEILTPIGETVTVFADSFGAFSTVIAAPTTRGTYSTSILLTFGSEIRTVKKTINVI